MKVELLCPPGLCGYRFYNAIMRMEDIAVASTMKEERNKTLFSCNCISRRDFIKSIAAGVLIGAQVFDRESHAQDSPIAVAESPKVALVTGNNRRENLRKVMELLKIDLHKETDLTPIKILLTSEEEVGYVYYGDKLGLGVGDIKKIQLVGADIEIVSRKFKPNPNYATERLWKI